MSQNQLCNPATPAQINTLRAMGRLPDRPISQNEANYLIKRHFADWAQLPVTERQEWRLRNEGMFRPGMTRGEAAKIIGRLPEWGAQADMEPAFVIPQQPRRSRV